MINLNVMIGVTVGLAAITAAVAVFWKDEPAVAPAPQPAAPAPTMGDAERAATAKSRNTMRVVVAAIHRARKEGFVVEADARYTLREAQHLIELLNQLEELEPGSEARETHRRLIALKLAKTVG